MNPILKYTIYQIKHKENPHCYIGATRHYKARLALHKTHYKHNKQNHLYNTIRLNGGLDAYEFVILEEFACMSRTDGEQRENYWIQKYETQMQLLNTYKRNMVTSIPEDIKHKWYYKQRLHNMQLGRSYYYKNRESILARMKEKYEALRAPEAEATL